jgi:DUF1680 family protein
MNVSRLVASVAGYFYGVAETEVAVHLYGGAATTLRVADGEVKLTETSNYPWDGRIRIEVEPHGAGAFTLSLRVPSWCEDASATLNGQALPMETDLGYLKIAREWSAGDVVHLDLPMEPGRLYAHPDVRADAGKVALRRGPLVYCCEQHDNPAKVNRLRLPQDAILSSRFNADLLGGVAIVDSVAMVADADPSGGALYSKRLLPEFETELTAVPYYIWCNRGPNEMQVWLQR